MPGYKVDFVHPMKPGLICSQCGFVLKDAVQTGDGIRLCESCYNVDIAGASDLELNSEKTGIEAVRREVLQLLVKCSNHQSGCPWIGQLNNYETHSQDCRRRFKPVQYPTHGCVEVLSKELCQAETESSLNEGEALKMFLSPCEHPRDPHSWQRPTDGHEYYRDYCNFYCLQYPRELDNGMRRLENRVMLQCADPGEQAEMVHGLHPIPAQQEFGADLMEYLRKEVAEQGRQLAEQGRQLAEQGRQLKEQGRQLKELERQIAEQGRQLAEQGRQLKELERQIAGDCRIVQLEKKVEELERQTALVKKVHVSEVELQLQASHNGTIIWRIPDVSRRRRDAIDERITSIYNPPFYTGSNGYKMCIQVYLNGDGIGYKTHLSLFFVLMKGEYDPLLKWPFEYKVSLILVDQNHRKHIVQTFKPTPESSSFQRPRSDMNVTSGCPQFSELSVLDDDNYVKDDVMYVKCIVDTSRIFHP